MRPQAWGGLLGRRCCRYRTRRASSNSRGASRRWASSSFRPAAPRKALADAGLAVTDVGSYTGFPEMLDGRVKTLHPKDSRRHPRAPRPARARRRAARARHPDDRPRRRQPLSLSRAAVARPGCTLEDAIENIDIGGPSMVRAAAKNWPHVGVVVDPADYPGVLAELADQAARSATPRGSDSCARRSRTRPRTTARSRTG